jgi:hypothetical protein
MKSPYVFLALITLICGCLYAILKHVNVFISVCNLVLAFIIAGILLLLSGIEFVTLNFLTLYIGAFAVFYVFVALF